MLTPLAPEVICKMQCDAHSTKLTYYDRSATANTQFSALMQNTS